MAKAKKVADNVEALQQALDGPLKETSDRFMRAVKKLNDIDKTDIIQAITMKCVVANDGIFPKDDIKVVVEAWIELMNVFYRWAQFLEGQGKVLVDDDGQCVLVAKDYETERSKSYKEKARELGIIG